MPKRAREEEEEIEEPSKRRKISKKRAPRKETPLSKFRKQTILRKKALLKVIRESNSELRAIARDLGKLSRNVQKK